MPDVLKEICATTRESVEARKAVRSEADLLAAIQGSGDAPRGFARALGAMAERGRPALIAEIKKASPSAGLIRAEFSPRDLALAYERGGAACLSVLTEETRFQGCEAYLVEARSAVSLPVLRKDFMIDPWQVLEARAMGADAILLIMACLDDALARDMEALAAAHGMDVLAEVHDEAELERALTLLNTPLIGVNNRNLRTLVTDLAVTERLAPLVPADRVLVCESGIRTREDIARMRTVGAQRFLIGETFMRQPDIEAAVTDLIGL
ncbi:indole-3-glycerol phosphate synthase TrpC [Phaeovibrio sulfidiphilus]|uniref:Indole-3-glycerol phosphate synthase n=1 Tax=Phaeovibrio sulfidiphilus TaxID=1220600 RepID=A0A8J6YM38_9PROT|nr:indole-3-glycerol phosphate synthase TrpC [Phaeovibrio sulfidiphilus]